MLDIEKDPLSLVSTGLTGAPLISAEIGRDDGKGAAAGALAAELAAITLGQLFVEPATRNNQIQSAGRIVGAITGLL